MGIELKRLTKIFLVEGLGWNFKKTGKEIQLNLSKKTNDFLEFFSFILIFFYFNV